MRINPAGLPAPIGAFSHIASHPVSGTIVHVSGQIGADLNGAVPASAAEQTTLAFENIERLLASQGLTPRAIVKLLTFVVGAESFGQFAAARRPIFERWYPDGDYPAHSAAEVTGLARPDLLIEIEGIAHVP